MRATKYELLNVLDGHKIQDKNWTLSDPDSASASMVRAIYEEKMFSPDPDEDGLYRYHRWLPVKRSLKGSCAPVTYKSQALAAKLGLNNLYITFSGWWPEKEAKFRTCSFKETEAYSVCARLSSDEKRTLVVASAGNTARAFAKVCSDNEIPLVICIPFDNMNAMWFDSPLNPCVKIIAAPSGSDYYDAITLGDKLCTCTDYLAEGGAKNIARRDGMGTTLLSAVETTGTIPDYYFQAIGSGTGAIAVWENNLRLIEDGRFGRHKMHLMTSQNDPFTIMYDSWQQSGRQLVDYCAERARKAAAEIEAKVLSNRKPPYSIAGGLFDASCDTQGTIYKICNSELDVWKAEFEKLEGIDIHNAAAVAVASLAHAVESSEIGADELIMLNITGGGEERAKSELGPNLYQAKANLIIRPDADAESIVEQVKKI